MLPDGLASDPRLLPHRGDIAAEHLRGAFRAARFVAGARKQVRVGATGLRKAPDAAAEQVNQALFGEGFTAYDEQEGWAWGQLEADHYIGWMRADELGPHADATHRVSALRTFIHDQPDMKSAPRMAVSMNAVLALEEIEGNFARVSGSGWIFANHVSLLGDFEADFVAVAERFVGSPYLWGGRESAGIDCSGLVQVSLQATGRAPLRDTDMQAQTLGEPVDLTPDFAHMRRGDLVFWRGHVGIMVDAANLLHASARDLKVEIEPLHEAVARIRPIAGDVRGVRRF